MSICQQKNIIPKKNANKLIRKSLRDITNGIEKPLSENEWSDIGKKRGIYLIQNDNGKFYIGSTNTGFAKRLRAHLWRLERSDHPNPHLQASYKLNGVESFKFLIIEIVEDDFLIKIREQKYLDDLIGGLCYNVSDAAHCPMLGRKHTPETIAKIRAASLRNASKIGKLTRERQLGKKHSALTILKMRASARSRDDSKRLLALATPEHRAKISALMKGVPKSPEHREKLRVILTARNKSRGKNFLTLT